MGRYDGNVRVQGPVIDLFRDFDPAKFLVPSSTNGLTEGFMAGMANPGDGFEAFRLGNAHVRFIGNPWQLGPLLGASLAPYWNNSLGAVLVADPTEDALGIIALHSAAKNTWSPLLRSGQVFSGKDVVWQGLGGVMADPGFRPEPYLWPSLLTGLSRSDLLGQSRLDYGQFTPDELALMIFGGTFEKVLAKAAFMATKWVYIDEGLRNMQAPVMTMLAGMKGVVVHRPTPDGVTPSDSAKLRALQMLAGVARLLGIYISGGDQGTSQDPFWTDQFALVAPNNMAGSRNAHELIRGRYPSEYTANGVYVTFKPMMRHIFGHEKVPIFFQGVGGVGANVIRRSIQDRLQIAGITDMFVGHPARDGQPARGLFLAKQMLAEAGYRGVPLIWDKKAATNGTSAEVLAAQEALAREAGFLIADDGLTEALELATQHGPYRNIGIFSPNAGSHAITMKRLVMMERLGIKAVLGADNNMLGPDGKGSYRTMAHEAVKRNIFIPADSGINRFGANIVIYNALRYTDEMVERMCQEILNRVLLEWEAFKQGLPPQIFSDQFAMREHNRAVLMGEKIGGLFHEVLADGGDSSSSPPQSSGPRGSGSGDGSGSGNRPRHRAVSDTGGAVSAASAVSQTPLIITSRSDPEAEASQGLVITDWSTTAHDEVTGDETPGIVLANPGQITVPRGAISRVAGARAARTSPLRL